MLITIEVERMVASRVGHCTRLNSVLRSSKNWRNLLNINNLSSWVLVQTVLLPYRFGRTDRDRTCDLRFWRPMLYQLSYCPVCHSFGNATWTPCAAYEGGPSGSISELPSFRSSSSCSLMQCSCAACTRSIQAGSSLSSYRFPGLYLEPRSRFELPTSSLPRKRSTTELPRLIRPSFGLLVGREGFEPSKASAVRFTV